MEMDENTTSCTEDVRSQFSANMTLCNFMLAALTIGYASFGAVGGFLSLYVSTRVIALMGGSVVVTSFFITSLYTSNVYVMMFCSFGVLYGVGAGFMWRYDPTNCVIPYSRFPFLIYLSIFQSLTQ